VIDQRAEGQQAREEELQQQHALNNNRMQNQYQRPILLMPFRDGKKSKKQDLLNLLQLEGLITRQLLPASSTKR